MLVLGIDPGTRHTGWCFLQERHARAHGVIEWAGPPVTSGTIQHVLASLRHCIHQYGREPFVAAVEGVEWQGRPRKRLLALGQLAGAIVGFLVGHNIPVYLLSPRMKSRKRIQKGWSEHEMDARSLAQTALRAEHARTRSAPAGDKPGARGLSSIVARRVPGLD